MLTPSKVLRSKITLFKLSARLVPILLLPLIFSCTSTPRRLTYFNDLKYNYENNLPIENSIETRIQPDDQLNISVVSQNAESNNLFSSGVLQSSGGLTGYLVDKEGSIQFPVVGKLKVSGLTVVEAAAKLSKIISENYVKNPIINVQITNFKVTVIGKVNAPHSIPVPNGKISILEAIGLAGDISDVGDRENVLVIREVGGVRSTIKMNLANKESLNSPYFYLRQNDIVYVQPDKYLTRVARRETIRTILPYLTFVSTITVLISRIGRL